ncbi:hypothetical protein BBJ28_00017824 [Nothophytophthora sp. Chile5]|nr:hypothetical protein BBJ28_00017824 [Nothophytophthora sp. Chile5]
MFSSWDLVRPRFWYPMSSLEQSMMELDHMGDLMTRSRFPFDDDDEMLAAPSNSVDDEFFKDLPVLTREQKPKTQHMEAKAPSQDAEESTEKEEGRDDRHRRAFSSYSFSDSSVVDDKGRRVTSTRRRYEDSTGRLKAVHERQIEGKKLRTTWNRQNKQDQGQHEAICSSGSPDEFEALWQQTPFGEAQKKTIKDQQQPTEDTTEKKTLENAKMDETASVCDYSLTASRFLCLSIDKDRRIQSVASMKKLPAFLLLLLVGDAVLLAVAASTFHVVVPDLAGLIYPPSATSHHVAFGDASSLFSSAFEFLAPVSASSSVCTAALLCLELRLSSAFQLDPFMLHQYDSKYTLISSTFDVWNPGEILPVVQGDTSSSSSEMTMWQFQTNTTSPNASQDSDSDSGASPVIDLLLRLRQRSQWLSARDQLLIHVHVELEDPQVATTSLETYSVYGNQRVTHSTRRIASNALQISLTIGRDTEKRDVVPNDAYPRNPTATTGSDSRDNGSDAEPTVCLECSALLYRCSIPEVIRGDCIYATSTAPLVACMRDLQGFDATWFASQETGTSTAIDVAVNDCFDRMLLNEPSTTTDSTPQGRPSWWDQLTALSCLAANDCPFGSLEGILNDIESAASSKMLQLDNSTLYTHTFGARVSNSSDTSVGELRFTFSGDLAANDGVDPSPSYSVVVSDSISESSSAEDVDAAIVHALPDILGTSFTVSKSADSGPNGDDWSFTITLSNLLFPAFESAFTFSPLMEDSYEIHSFSAFSRLNMVPMNTTKLLKPTPNRQCEACADLLDACRQLEPCRTDVLPCLISQLEALAGPTPVESSGSGSSSSNVGDTGSQAATLGTLQAGDVDMKRVDLLVPLAACVANLPMATWAPIRQALLCMAHSQCVLGSDDGSEGFPTMLRLNDGHQSFVVTTESSSTDVVALTITLRSDDEPNANADGIKTLIFNASASVLGRFLRSFVLFQAADVSVWMSRDTVDSKALQLDVTYSNALILSTPSFSSSLEPLLWLHNSPASAFLEYPVSASRPALEWLIAALRNRTELTSNVSKPNFTPWSVDRLRFDTELAPVLLSMSARTSWSTLATELYCLADRPCDLGYDSEGREPTYLDLKRVAVLLNIRTYADTQWEMWLNGTRFTYEADVSASLSPLEAAEAFRTWIEAVVGTEPLNLAVQMTENWIVEASGAATGVLGLYGSYDDLLGRYVMPPLAGIPWFSASGGSTNTSDGLSRAGVTVTLWGLSLWSVDSAPQYDKLLDILAFGAGNVTVNSSTVAPTPIPSSSKTLSLTDRCRECESAIVRCQNDLDCATSSQEVLVPQLRTATLSPLSTSVYDERGSARVAVSLTPFLNSMALTAFQTREGWNALSAELLCLAVKCHLDYDDGSLATQPSYLSIDEVAVKLSVLTYADTQWSMTIHGSVFSYIPESLPIYEAAVAFRDWIQARATEDPQNLEFEGGEVTIDEQSGAAWIVVSLYEPGRSMVAPYLIPSFQVSGENTGDSAELPRADVNVSLWEISLWTVNHKPQYGKLLDLLDFATLSSDSPSSTSSSGALDTNSSSSGDAVVSGGYDCDECLVERQSCYDDSNCQTSLTAWMVPNLRSTWANIEFVTPQDLLFMMFNEVLVPNPTADSRQKLIALLNCSDQSTAVKASCLQRSCELSTPDAVADLEIIPATSEFTMEVGGNMTIYSMLGGVQTYVEDGDTAALSTFLDGLVIRQHVWDQSRYYSFDVMDTIREIFDVEVYSSTLASRQKLLELLSCSSQDNPTGSCIQQSCDQGMAGDTASLEIVPALSLFTVHGGDQMSMKYGFSTGVYYVDDGDATALALFVEEHVLGGFAASGVHALPYLQQMAMYAESVDEEFVFDATSVLLSAVFATISLGAQEKLLAVFTCSAEGAASCIQRASNLGVPDSTASLEIEPAKSTFVIAAGDQMTINFEGKAPGYTDDGDTEALTAFLESNVLTDYPASTLEVSATLDSDTGLRSYTFVFYNLMSPSLVLFQWDAATNPDLMYSESSTMQLRFTGSTVDLLAAFKPWLAWLYPYSCPECTAQLQSCCDDIYCQPALGAFVSNPSSYISGDASMASLFLPQSSPPSRQKLLELFACSNGACIQRSCDMGAPGAVASLEVVPATSTFTMAAGEEMSIQFAEASGPYYTEDGDIAAISTFIEDHVLGYASGVHVETVATFDSDTGRRTYQLVFRGLVGSIVPHFVWSNMDDSEAQESTEASMLFTFTPSMEETMVPYSAWLGWLASGMATLGGSA